MSLSMFVRVGETANIWPGMRSFSYLKYTFNIRHCIIALMNATFLSFDHFYSSSRPKFPTGGPLKETVFAFKRNMRGFRGVKPPVH